MSLDLEEIIAIPTLAKKLAGQPFQDQVDCLATVPGIREFLEERQINLDEYPLEERSIIQQLIAIQQFPDMECVESSFEYLKEVNQFYAELGGLIGYQAQVQRLLESQNFAVRESPLSDANILFPPYVDLSTPSSELKSMIEAGIEALPLFAEIYPIGGAADRLSLSDATHGHLLPAAKLTFGGKTLLEGLFRDLAAREQLYFQKTGKKIFLPIAIMVSEEKSNARHVQELLEANQWFGRPKERFFIFTQPLVPLVDTSGQWQWDRVASKLLLKPGGHGALWKLARDLGVLRWLRGLGVRYGLVRQINNPLAGMDYGLMAFAGFGAQHQMSFGFVSCPRLCHTAEGVNVLIEKKKEKGYVYQISSIEYCDFGVYGIEDRPVSPHTPYSRFPSNTNILFVDLEEVEKAVASDPFPGLILNFKQGGAGTPTGRIESRMQNIADVFVEDHAKRLSKQATHLNKVFIAHNHRHKTMSTTKRARVAGQSLRETAEQCFYDLLYAYRELLTHHCKFILPQEKSLDEVLQGYPPFVFLFHPALGPFFETIGKKLQGGSLGEGSELRLEIADLNSRSLHVEGSFQVLCENPLEKSPRCVLENVSIKNQGVDWAQSSPFWKGHYEYSESCVIVLEGRSECVIRNKEIVGNQHWVVRDGEGLLITGEEVCRYKLRK